MATKKSDQNPEDYPPGAGGHWEMDDATGDRRWIYDNVEQNPTPGAAGTASAPEESK